MFDRQIAARFAVKAQGSPPSVSVPASPICGSHTAAATASLPQDYLNFLLVQNSADLQRGILYTFQRDANAQRI